MHVPLFKDQSAELRDPESVTVGQRDAMHKAIQAARTGEGDDTDPYAVAAEVFPHVLVSWTLDLPLPGTEGSDVRAIPALAFDKLDTAATEILRALSPEIQFAPSTDPESPTTPSDESN